MTRVLIVDDDELGLETTNNMLRMAKFESVPAGSGKAALDILRRQQFDVVVTDIIMPDMDGIETIQAIRQIRPEIAIVAVSGGGRTRTPLFVKMAAELGNAVALQKPFSLAQLKEAIALALGRLAAAG